MLNKHSTCCAYRFNIFVHDELKAEIMALHKDDPVKQDMVEMISSPAYLMLQEQSGRRFIKTHLPFSLLPPNLLDTCKVFSSHSVHYALFLFAMCAFIGIIFRRENFKSRF
jgi:hypothetical protein